MEAEEVAEDRVEWHLTNWATWMRTRGHKLGYPSRASGRMGVSGSSDFDAMVANADNLCAAATHAIIGDMPRPLAASVHTMHLGDLFPAVYRFRKPIEDYYDEAREFLREGLARKAIW